MSTENNPMVRREFEEMLRFETLLADLSARVIKPYFGHRIRVTV